jgi:hypothetical protein
MFSSRGLPVLHDYPLTETFVKVWITYLCKKARDEPGIVAVNKGVEQNLNRKMSMDLQIKFHKNIQL